MLTNSNFFFLILNKFEDYIKLYKNVVHYVANNFLIAISMRKKVAFYVGSGVLKKAWICDRQISDRERKTFTFIPDLAYQTILLTLPHEKKRETRNLGCLSPNSWAILGSSNAIWIFFASWPIFTNSVYVRISPTDWDLNSLAIPTRCSFWNRRLPMYP